MITLIRKPLAFLLFVYAFTEAFGVDIIDFGTGEKTGQAYTFGDANISRTAFELTDYTVIQASSNDGTAGFDGAGYFDHELLRDLSSLNTANSLILEGRLGSGTTTTTTVRVEFFTADFGKKSTYSFDVSGWNSSTFTTATASSALSSPVQTIGGGFDFSSDELAYVQMLDFTGAIDDVDIDIDTIQIGTSYTDYTWDSNGGTAGTGGTGNWDTSSSLWDNGGLTTWPTSGSANRAILDGTAGTLTLTTGISVNSISVDPTSGATYTVQSNTLTIGGEMPGISVASGDTLVLNSQLSGSDGFRKFGDGTLQLGSTSNDFTGVLTVNNGTVQLTASGVVTDSVKVLISDSGTFDLNDHNETIGSLSGGPNNVASVDLGSARLTAGGNNDNTTFGGVISGTGELEKAGSGTLTLSGSNTYTGDTIVSTGTLMLGANNALSGSSDLILGGGIFATGGFDQTLGNLTLTADSIIDMGAGDSILTFAGTSIDLSTYTLSVYNWSGNTQSGDGTDQLLFSGDTLGLGELDQVRFYSDGGSTPLFGNTLWQNIQLGDGEVVPIPESSTWFTGAVLFGFCALRIRRRACLNTLLLVARRVWMADSSE